MRGLMPTSLQRQLSTLGAPFGLQVLKLPSSSQQPRPALRSQAINLMQITTCSVSVTGYLTCVPEPYATSNGKTG